eukprot:SAG31_NODE_2730_length_5177_cov_2.436392_4_plen_95_part_00
MVHNSVAAMRPGLRGCRRLRVVLRCIDADCMRDGARPAVPSRGCADDSNPRLGHELGLLLDGSTATNDAKVRGVTFSFLWDFSRFHGTNREIRD